MTLQSILQSQTQFQIMSESFSPIPILCGTSEIASSYDLWLCDIWGVIHNGLQTFPRAIRACQDYRKSGGRIVLISNAPRPHQSIESQLEKFGVPETVYDYIVTSGDVTRELISAPERQPLFHLGPECDLSIFQGLDIHLCRPEEAKLIVCTGLHADSTEIDDTYIHLLDKLRALDLDMVCANPDIVVEMGAQIVYCAGALAEIYEQKGGKVTYTGKPYAPIYRLALEKIMELKGMGIDKERVLAIGDGLKTDMRGAEAMGFDALFIASGVHLEGYHEDAKVNGTVLASLFSDLQSKPIAAQGQLTW